MNPNQNNTTTKPLKINKMADERDIKHFNKMANESKQMADNYMSLKGALEPKQETLEEAAEIYANIWFKNNAFTKELFVEGAKWQAERMYSEEELRKAYFSGISSTGEGWNGEYADGSDPNIEEKFSEGFTQWFKQFKKK
jgi:hypothetical protein